MGDRPLIAGAGDGRVPGWGGLLRTCWPDWEGLLYSQADGWTRPQKGLNHMPRQLKRLRWITVVYRQGRLLIWASSGPRVSRHHILCVLFSVFVLQQLIKKKKKKQLNQTVHLIEKAAAEVGVFAVSEIDKLGALSWWCNMLQKRSFWCSRTVWTWLEAAD